jgi:ADP-heptose:LPS heptosyltransferase
VRKLLLRVGFAPGDGVMLTAAVRDLHRTYPGEFLVDVRSPYRELWRHNPYITPLDSSDPQLECVQCDYPLIQCSNQFPAHFLHGFIQHLNETLQLSIRPTEFKGDIHLSTEERTSRSQVADLVNHDLPFWLISAGGKFDLTIKWWEASRWQTVVDHFRDRILFVQVGNSRHFHPALRGVLDIRGWTNLRQLIHLVFHAQGVLCPVTCLMHLAAAVERPDPTRGIRPCIVVAGGREAAHWEAYPGHRFIDTIGRLPCCAQGGCWKRRTVPLGDGHENDRAEHLCTSVERGLPRCMDMITPNHVIDAIEGYLAGGQARELTSGEVPVARRAAGLTTGAAIDSRSVTKWTARQAFENAAARIPAPPCPYAGRGIVIEASGLDYFACAWVCLRILRRLGCDLPIELWHRGASAWNEAYDELLRPYLVRVVDASAVLAEHPADVAHPFALKPYAIIYSSFREVLWLDADQVPVQNPEFLFGTRQYQETGAVFWPDFGRFGPEHPLWRLTGVSYRDEPEVQAGEILVDKERCWEPLRLALWMNEHHRFYYKYMIGDKDSYRFAWHKLNRPYTMAPFPLHPLTGTMCQHDFEGRRLFQHRNRRKWRLDGNNPHVEGFWEENRCLEYLEELRNFLSMRSVQARAA